MKKERQAEVARAIVEIVAGEEQGIRRLDLIKRLEAKLTLLRPPITFKVRRSVALC